MSPPDPRLQVTNHLFSTSAYKVTGDTRFTNHCGYYCTSTVPCFVVTFFLFYRKASRLHIRASVKADITFEIFDRSTEGGTKNPKYFPTKIHYVILTRWIRRCCIPVCGKGTVRVRRARFPEHFGRIWCWPAIMHG